MIFKLHRTGKPGTNPGRTQISPGCPGSLPGNSPPVSVVPALSPASVLLPDVSRAPCSARSLSPFLPPFFSPVSVLPALHPDSLFSPSSSPSSSSLPAVLPEPLVLPELLPVTPTHSLLDDSPPGVLHCARRTIAPRDRVRRSCPRRRL